MPDTLHTYIRHRAAQLGLSLSALCRQAAISRHTLYALERAPRKLPSLTTLVALSQALDVHPMRLLQFVFDLVPIKPEQRRAASGDRSAFVDDVTFPDGAVVSPGQRFQKIWALQNVGSVPWQGRALVCQDDELVIYDARNGQVLLSPGLQPDQRHLPLPDVAPGGMLHAALWFTAPSQPCTVVSYWKMVDADGALCFPGATGLWLMVKVMGIGAVAMMGRGKSL